MITLLHFNCYVCNIEVIREAGQANRKRLKSNKRYCSKACMGADKRSPTRKANRRRLELEYKKRNPDKCSEWNKKSKAKKRYGEFWESLSLIGEIYEINAKQS